MKKLLCRAARAAAVLVLLLWFAWGALTLLFANLQPAGLRQALAGGYVLWLLAAGLLVRPRKRGLTVVLLSNLALSVVFFGTRPSNDRDWQPDVAETATAEVEGERVTLRGVRNFRYHGEDDYDEIWEEREYDLSRLRTLDLFMSFWGPVDYCHTILSFGFEGGEYLAASVEVRKEVGETFSTYAGFFKMFEVSYIFADERDVVGLRTNHRSEDVYLYRLRAEPTRLRELLLSYLDHANDLARAPEFYDVLDNSCGVNILHRIAESGKVPWVGREALLNGYWDESLYALGAIHQGLPFEELQVLSHINDAALAAGESPDFSARIRAGLPPAPAPETPGNE